MVRGVVLFLLFWVAWIVVWKVIFAVMDMSSYQFITTVFLAVLTSAGFGYYRNRKKPK